MKKIVYIAGILIVFVLLIQGVHCSKSQDNGPLETERAGSSMRHTDNLNPEESGQERPEQNGNRIQAEQEIENNGSEEVLVCKSKSSYAYHSHVCQGLKRCKAGTKSMSEKEAREAGYKACKYCY
jgi:hypothetical protein